MFILEHSFIFDSLFYNLLGAVINIHFINISSTRKKCADIDINFACQHISIYCYQTKANNNKKDLF